ncbi:MAG: hypothetical protein AAF471_05475, partial [Myxococcota bacterium]
MRTEGAQAKARVVGSEGRVETVAPNQKTEGSCTAQDTNECTLLSNWPIPIMQKDPHIPRFMCYLSIFTFFMLVLVTADNFIEMLLWLLYLLAIWYTKNLLI